MQFSLARLLLAVAAFAVALGPFCQRGVAGIVVSLVVGLSVGLICIVVKRNQIWPMTRTGLLTVLGGFVGLMFCPMIHPPYNPGDEFWYIGIGGLIGFAIGVSMTASQQSETDDSDTEDQNGERGVGEKDARS
jgi:hypothetical protein